MKHQLLQFFTAHVRSLSYQQQRFGLAVIVSVLLMLSSGLLPGGRYLQPLSALAQPIAFASASSFVGSQTISANQPIASATSRMSAIVVNRLRRNLSQRTSIPVAKLKLVETKPKTWNDGCFGLAQPDEICTQALVTGWRVAFSDGNQRWIYRTDQQGRGYRLEP